MSNSKYSAPLQFPLPNPFNETSRDVTFRLGNRQSPSVQRYYAFAMDFVCAYRERGGRLVLTQLVHHVVYAWKCIGGVGLNKDEVVLKAPSRFFQATTNDPYDKVDKISDTEVIRKTLTYLRKADNATLIRIAASGTSDSQSSAVVLLEALVFCMRGEIHGDSQSQILHYGDCLPDNPNSSAGDSTDVLPDSNNSGSILDPNVPISTPPTAMPDSKVAGSEPPTKRVKLEPGLAGDDIEAINRVITNKGQVLWFPTRKDQLDEFFKLRHQERVVHERDLDRQTTKAKVMKDCGKFATGSPKEVPKSYLDSLKTLESWRTADEAAAWREAQKEFFELVCLYMEELKKRGLIPLRFDWTQNTDGSFQTFIASILSANTRDKKLFDVVWAMRKLGIFDEGTLAEYNLTRLQDLFLYVGYNNW